MEEVRRKEEEDFLLYLIRNPAVGLKSRGPGTTGPSGGTPAVVQPTA